jgi:hypothetical protein
MVGVAEQVGVEEGVTVGVIGVGEYASGVGSGILVGVDVVGPYVGVVIVEETVTVLLLVGGIGVLVAVGVNVGAVEVGGMGMGVTTGHSSGGMGGDNHDTSKDTIRTRAVPTHVLSKALRKSGGRSRVRITPTPPARIPNNATWASVIRYSKTQRSGFQKTKASTRAGTEPTRNQAIRGWYGGPF